MLVRGKLLPQTETKPKRIRVHNADWQRTYDIGSNPLTGKELYASRLDQFVKDFYPHLKVVSKALALNPKQDDYTAIYTLEDA